MAQKLSPIAAIGQLNKQLVDILHAEIDLVAVLGDRATEDELLALDAIVETVKNRIRADLKLVEELF